MMKRYCLTLWLIVFLFSIPSVVHSQDTMKSQRKPSSRIVGGTEAERGAWPWMAALVNSYSANAFSGQFCGGSLVHPRWMVTAAHCVNDDFGNVSDPSEIDIVLGVHDLENDPDSGIGDRISVKRIISHSDYDPDTMDSDIALLELSEDASSYETLPWNTDANLDGEDAVAIGWGNTSSTGKDFPERLQQVWLPIISNQTCENAYLFSSEITENMMCAGYSQGGKDSCQGDSGGPFVVQDGDGWKLAGVVSWGNGCALPGYYGVYAKVSRFAEFIEAYVPANAPVVTTNPAGNVAASAATLNGSINPNGEDTSYYFEYGTTTRYGAKTQPQIAGSGSVAVAVNAVLSGLNPRTTYHYRLTATNSSGTVYGDDQSFATSGEAEKPSAVTEAVTDITSNSVVLNGIVNPRGTDTTYHFEYGTTGDYGSVTGETSAGSGTDDVTASVTVTGLTPETRYYYRIIAENSVGISNGSGQVFVSGSPHPPSGQDDKTSAPVNTPVTIDVLANDSDPDGDALTVSSVTDPAHGTAMVNPGGETVTYYLTAMILTGENL